MEEKKHTSAEYERELQEIKDGLLYMGALTEKALEQGSAALLERNPEIARNLIREDEQIDRLDVELEEKCIRMLALRQPAARDLRFITTAIKITGHLERIGDMAANIAEKVLILQDLPQIKAYLDLPRMVEIARGMIRNGLDAMVREDVELADRVRAEDAVIDQLNDQIFRELLTFMMEDPRKIQVCLYIMQISKSLERIADHAEGIADMVIYMVTGKSVRHKQACTGKRLRIRLFYKFFIAFLAIGIAAVAVSGLLIERKLKTDLTQSIEDEMTSGARIIALIPTGGIAGHVGELAESARARLTLIDAAGRVLADSGLGTGELDNHLNRSELQEARLRGKGSSVRYSQTLKKDMLYVAIPLRDGSQTTGYVRLSRPLAEITRAVDGMRQSIFEIALVMAVFSLLIALLFSFKALSPIRKLAAFTKEVRTGKIPGALRIESRDEIGDLADNINGMVAALQEKIRKADEEKRKLESVFSGMSEGVMVLDAENRIESVNRGMEGMSGLGHGDMAGRTVLEAFRNIELHDLLERFRKNETTTCGEIDLGIDQPATMDVTISAVQSGAGGERKTMVVFHDVTRLKKLERIRTDFVANVTHEIRTPLTAIIGFAETLQRDAFENPETARKFLYTIRENAERLNRLVEDLLTLSGLELGETKLHLERLRIAEAIDQVLVVIEARVREKGLTVRKEIPGELPPILADRDRMAQILLNLLDNAVKFTPPGGSIDVTASPGEGGCLTVRIADTGVGIPKGEIPRLGERFYRADKTRSREMGGTGLGLSIVKHLMMAHRGRISIDSTLGHGTTVSLYFPPYREGADSGGIDPDCTDASARQ